MRKFFSSLQSPSGAAPAPHSGANLGNDAADPDRTLDEIRVKHTSNDHTISFPARAIAAGDVSVGDLRKRVKDATDIPYERVVLVSAGRNLTDDAAKLSDYGLAHGAKLLCIGSKGTASKSKKKKSKSKSAAAAAAAAQAPPKILTPAEKIEAVREGVYSNFGDKIKDFMENAPAEQDKREDAHRRVSETVMGELLKLDSIESSEPEVRARRKEVVKEIQGILDELDRVLKA
ncbi:hypothetical protein RUND412_000249 [Rhizina undulata]